MFIIVFLAAALAIDNATDLLTTLPQLESIRVWWRNKFPALARLSFCVYCQSFWLSLILAGFLPSIPGIEDHYLNYGMTVLILHRTAQFINGAYAKYFLQLEMVQDSTVDEKQSDL